MDLATLAIVVLLIFVVILAGLLVLVLHANVGLRDRVDVVTSERDYAIVTLARKAAGL